MNTVLAIVACILLFSFAIFIHEFGHFLAAKLLGFQVDTFSIGFGPALWKKKWRGVEFRISAIPFGGYVALPQLDPAGTAGVQGSQTEGEAAAQLPPVANWKKIVVAFAGPFGNIVLAVVLALVLSAVPSANFGELSTEIGDLVEDGPAANAGMQVGDRVLSVNGHDVKVWTDMMTEVQLAGEREAEFVVERGGTNVVLAITPQRDEVTGGCFIKAVSTASLRHYAAWMPDRSPWKQLAWDASSMARVLKALVTPKESGSAAKALGGPVLIAEGLYHQVRKDNKWDAFGFLRFLNVNLAVLNLLPIPVLDGGLILFSLIALIFRRPVPRKIVDGLSLVFMYLFLALMVTLVWRDVARSHRIHKARGEIEKKVQEEVQQLKLVKNFKPAFDLNTYRPLQCDPEPTEEEPTSAKPVEAPPPKKESAPVKQILLPLSTRQIVLPMPTKMVLPPGPMKREAEKM